MNPPRTYDELLAAATKGPFAHVMHENDVGPNDEWYWEWYEVGPFKCKSREDAELLRLLWNHGPAMVAALRAAETRLTLDELTLHSYGFSSPSSTLIQLRAVLAALDRKDAT